MIILTFKKTIEHNCHKQILFFFLLMLYKHVKTYKNITTKVVKGMTNTLFIIVIISDIDEVKYCLFPKYILYV